MFWWMRKDGEDGARNEEKRGERDEGIDLWRRENK